MPINNSIGFSSETPRKQYHFQELMFLNIIINSKIFGKYKANGWGEQVYYYIDMNAGSGHNPIESPHTQTCVNCGYAWTSRIQSPKYCPRCSSAQGNQKGSPLIFLDLIQRARLPYMGIFFERNKVNAQQLENVTKSDPNIKVLAMDHNVGLIPCLETISAMERHPRGLLYSDENGTPPFSLLAEASHLPVMRKMDFLIHLPATAIKRQLYSPVHKWDQYLIDALASIQKSCWIIREPADRWQWTFLLGTNYNDYPDYAKLGFYKLHSLKGREILRLLNFSREELAAMVGV